MRTSFIILLTALCVSGFMLSATAAPPQYTLTISVQGNGTTDPAPGVYSYRKNTVVSITAIPDSGYMFDSWTGDLSGSTNPTTIKIDANKTVTAVFVQAGPTTYTLTTAVQGSGLIDPAAGVHTYDANDVVTVTATPDAGWDFDHWEGDLSGSTNPDTVTMTADKSVTAVFTQPGVWPNSMAVIGDSISRAALADDSLDDDQPEHCWSTGEDIVNSHYNQILANNAGISGMNLNNAENGSRADDLLGQANTTVSQGVDYVTIEMGGNDLCRDTIGEMTPVATWEAYWNEALDVLQAGLPDATILVNSVVRVNRIYEVGASSCGFKWLLFDFCSSVTQSSDPDRAVVAQRNIDYNNILINLCAQKGIYYDPDIYSWDFELTDLSNVDCFHPAISAQEVFGQISYDASRF